MGFLEDLSTFVYTPDGTKAAEDYARSRGLDPSRFMFPWTISPSDPNWFLPFKHLYPPYMFVDSLYIPIVDFEDNRTLVAFEVRYLGTDIRRTRYMKLKEDKTLPILYYTQPLHTIRDSLPLLVTEGAIDAESLRHLGVPVVSPLTALQGLRFCAFLSAISSNVYFAYDNDDKGMMAKKKIQEELSVYPDVAKKFKVLSFSGKDVNDSLKMFGRENFGKMIQAQIGV